MDFGPFALTSSVEMEWLCRVKFVQASFKKAPAILPRLTAYSLVSN